MPAVSHAVAGDLARDLAVVAITSTIMCEAATLGGPGIGVVLDNDKLRACARN